MEISENFRIGKKVIATTASELHAMLEQFNIQINNPVAILMQETSKQFLSTAKPKDKYKVCFFWNFLGIFFNFYYFLIFFYF